VVKLQQALPQLRCQPRRWRQVRPPAHRVLEATLCLLAVEERHARVTRQAAGDGVCLGVHQAEGHQLRLPGHLRQAGEVQLEGGQPRQRSLHLEELHRGLGLGQAGTPVLELHGASAGLIRPHIHDGDEPDVLLEVHGVHPGELPVAQGAQHGDQCLALCGVAQRLVRGQQIDPTLGVELEGQAQEHEPQRQRDYSTHSA
jgi:hypothetical protein